jgi:hypothetical protein
VAPVVADAAQRLGPFRVPGDRDPEQQVRVPADELRAAVDDHVASQLKRPLQERRREGVVDDRGDAALAGGVGQPREIGDPDHRVRRRLEPEHRGAVELGDDGIRIGDVDRRRLHPPGPLVAAHQPPDAEVGDGGVDHPGAQRQRLQHG